MLELELPIKKIKFSSNSLWDESIYDSESNQFISDISSNSDNSPCAPSKYIIFYQPNVCCLKLYDEIWNTLYLKDFELESSRNDNMMSKHSELRSSHRAILLDWIMEICDLFTVCRDTYYLTLDYLDRFLSRSTGIKRSELQLVGITCLFIASKVEEVKPIIAVDLVFLTDNLYSEDELFRMEIVILKTLDWRTCTWTANKWLSAYLHIIKRLIKRHEYLLLTELLDMATLDIDSLKFSYSVLAATCIYTTLSMTIGFNEHSHLNHLHVCECAIWMNKFWRVEKKYFIEQPPKLIQSIPYCCKILNFGNYQSYNNILEKFKEAILAELDYFD